MPALDGIRGLAVLLVLLDHASDQQMRFFPGADLNRLGKFGVYLFFVLSAFLLTSQLYALRPEDLLTRRTWLHYATRRFLRIFPVYTVVLVAMIAMRKLKLEDFWTHLLLRDGRRVYWTIPVEVKFYLLLPVIAIALCWAARKGRKQAIWACLGATVVCGAFLWAEQTWSLHENVLLAPNLPPFLFGVASAVAFARLREHPAAPRVARWFAPVAIAAAAFALLRLPIFVNQLRPEDPISKWAFDEVICGILWSMFVLGTVLTRGLLSKAMQWAPLRYLGLISFSAYLWHWKFVTDVDDLPVPPVLRLLAFLGIVVAVASASYFLLERPFLRMRPWGSRGQIPAKTASATAAS
jgi:peptidoglycan/LPS O-acetylase OafA/YrhL